MSPVHQVALEANLGGGWVAPGGAARGALFDRAGHVERHQDRRSLRLDLGKGMFLDPAPAEIDPRAAREVTRYIVQQMAPVRRVPS